MALQERAAAALLQGPSRPLVRSCMCARRRRRAAVTAAAQAAPADGAGGTQQVRVAVLAALGHAGILCQG